MKGRKCIVTGGAGFVGSNLSYELNKQGAKVKIIDNMYSGENKNIKFLKDRGVEIVNGSITDKEMLDKEMRGYEFVFHQAALVSVIESIEKPEMSHKINLEGTINVLETSRKNEIEKVVFASSCAVYGDTVKLPVSENDKTNPMSPYAKDKLMGEKKCMKYDQEYDLPVVCLRYFNIYGPRQSVQSAYAAAIPKFIEKILAGNKIEIYGDGKQTRDFVFIEDIVQANLKAAMEKNARNCFVNIGSGKEITINAIAKKIMKIIGKEIDFEYKDEREGEIRNSYADISKAKEVLKYEPQWDLEKGLIKTCEFYR